ncbi:polysaccharide deacetylase family protein [Micromonospora sp. BRA006-A]|nr:polysaccharide deacetylase family protein [Micromonospora sp. BRA006-A]
MNLGRRSAAEIRSDLERTNEAIHAAAPKAPITWFRQPGGRWTAEEVTIAKQMGLRPLHWTWTRRTGITRRRRRSSSG